MASVQNEAPRYDGFAGWYDERNAAPAEAGQDPLRELLGPGEGLCLDLGCGSGRNLRTIRATGRTVVGLDHSAERLLLARRRTAGGERLVRGEAAALPFADAVFSTVAALWLSAAVDGFAAVLGEASRVLRPGGVLAYYGAHPRREPGPPSHPGMRHLPLADLLDAFTDAGLVITNAVEPHSAQDPWVLALRAEKP